MQLLLNTKNKIMKLKGQPIEDWETWLKTQINENPDNLKDDEKYVFEAFLELIEKCKK